MPAKNIVKRFYEGGYYHVYNRGVEKRLIFIDDQDCQVFMKYIKLYLSSKDTIEKLGTAEIRVRRFANLNLAQEVDLLCFALMPNHFHLLLKNKSVNGVKKFMQRLTTAYVMYFNKKYKRVGPLFQNIYKASTVTHDSYLLHLSRYIHNNSLKIATKNVNFANYGSYRYYVAEKSAEWIKTDMILSYFQNFISPQDIALSYKRFVEMDITDSLSILDNQKMLLEDKCG